MTSTIKQRIQDDMKAAMRAKEKARLTTIRLILAAVKQIEVDERIELDDTQMLVVLDKMAKQRRDSIEQYENAQRQDLAEKEKAELVIIQDYLPQALTESELIEIIDAAIQESGATSAKDMGQVMGLVKPQAQGRADMKLVSGLVKQRLS